MRRQLVISALVSALCAPLLTAGRTPLLAEVNALATTTLPVGLETLGSVGSIGIHYNATGVDPYGGYEEMLRWDATGNWLTFDHDLNSGTFGHPTGTVSGVRVPDAATYLRFESYPSTAVGCDGDTALDDCYWEIYDTWDPRHGAFHLQIEREAGTPWPSLGGITPPTPGDQFDGFVSRGRIVSSTPIGEGRVHVDSFQIDCAPHERCIAPPTTTTGVAYGAFASGSSRGELWTMGVTWPGHHTMFIEDVTAGIKVQVIADIAPATLPTIDLDAPCFGFTTCVTISGAASPTAPAAEFHPMAPVRILDTRKELGISGGVVQPGDGSADTSNADLRVAAVANHELKVTGVAGIPESGVAAVLLNVTAVDPAGDGFITIGPRPTGRGNVFDDQNSFGTWPSSSNLNLSAGVTTPNMVLVRVGAGGLIRFHVYGTTTHVLADVAGWFGPSDAEVSGFTPVQPKRLLDTRHEPTGQLTGGTTRLLTVAGVAGIPLDADSVVANITAVSPSGNGYVTAYPSGTSLPDVSNLNMRSSVTRPNLAVIAIGDDGKIALRPELADTHLLVDVFGYYRNDSGAATTTASPFRIVDSRNGIGTTKAPFGSSERRRVSVAGVGGVPSTASAIYLNITVVSPTGEGFLSVWPAGGDVPNVSNLNWVSGDTVPNMAVVGLGDDGSIDVRVDLPWDASATAEVLVDVLGWTS